MTDDLPRWVWRLIRNANFGDGGGGDGGGAAGDAGATGADAGASAAADASASAAADAGAAGAADSSSFGGGATADTGGFGGAADTGATGGFGGATGGAADTGTGGFGGGTGVGGVDSGFGGGTGAPESGTQGSTVGTGQAAAPAGTGSGQDAAPAGTGGGFGPATGGGGGAPTGGLGDTGVGFGAPSGFDTSSDPNDPGALPGSSTLAMGDAPLGLGASPVSSDILGGPTGNAALGGGLQGQGFTGFGTGFGQGPDSMQGTGFDAFGGGPVGFQGGGPQGVSFGPGSAGSFNANPGGEFGGVAAGINAPGTGVASDPETDPSNTFGPTETATHGTFDPSSPAPTISDLTAAPEVTQVTGLPATQAFTGPAAFPGTGKDAGPEPAPADPAPAPSLSGLLGGAIQPTSTVAPISVIGAPAPIAAPQVTDTPTTAQVAALFSGGTTPTTQASLEQNSVLGQSLQDQQAAIQGQTAFGGFPDHATSPEVAPATPFAGAPAAPPSINEIGGAFPGTGKDAGPDAPPAPENPSILTGAPPPTTAQLQSGLNNPGTAFQPGGALTDQTPTTPDVLSPGGVDSVLSTGGGTLSGAGGTTAGDSSTVGGAGGTAGGGGTPLPGGTTPGLPPIDTLPQAQQVQVNAVFQQLVQDWTAEVAKEGIDNPAGLPQWTSILQGLQSQAEVLVLQQAASSSDQAVFPVGSNQGLPPGVAPLLGQPTDPASAGAQAGQIAGGGNVGAGGARTLGPADLSRQAA